MKNYIAPLLLTSAFVSAPALSDVEIEWKEHEEYTDIRPANDTRKAFAKRTFKQIEKHMNRLMRNMPEDYTLSLVVTDLDLAGRVQPGFFPLAVRGGFINLNNGTAINDIRVIDGGADFPSIEFSYTLTDASGKVVRSGEEDLKDLGYQQRTLRLPRNDEFRYEKRMLDSWFSETFNDLKADNKAT